MANVVQKLGDNTTREVKPDFESGKGYYWMKAVRDAEQAGVLDTLPRAPKPRTLAKQSFADQIHTRLARRNYASLGIAFDANGRIIRE